MTGAGVETLVDTARYPLDRPDDPNWVDLLARGRAELAAAGSFNLDGFLHEEAISRAVAEIEAGLARCAHHHLAEPNIYFSDEENGGAATAKTLRSSNWTLAGDQLRGGVLDRVYRWPGLPTFLAALFDQPALYPMADPLACLNAMSYGPGDGLGWHFDRAEFTVTLLLRAAGAGGLFEYRRNLRAADDANRKGVARFLRGEDPDVAAIALAPGTLNIFAGYRSAHQVTPVAQGPSRLISVLSFMERDDVVFTAADRRRFYGRSAPDQSSRAGLGSPKR